jgi:glycosyltransferase involved in cell wall biosynthesis
MRKARIAIDLRIGDPRQGVGTFGLALADGLSRLTRTDQEYLCITHEHSVDWLKPHIFGPCTLVTIPSPEPDPPATSAQKIKQTLKAMPVIRPMWNRIRPQHVTLPASDGTVERLNCDLLHFPTQTAYTTTLPTIYQPWDLQHRHLPELFSSDEVLKRDRRYCGFSKLASAVCIPTEWGKQDLVDKFGLAPDKIAVIRCSTPLDAYEQPSAAEMQAISEKFHLPERFLIYPAVTWPHKNHENLLRGLAKLKQQHGTSIDIFFTGAPTPLVERLHRLVKELGLQETTHFLGFVDVKELRTLYLRALALIFPSRFEGLGLPVLEAFLTALPVACSSFPVLKEVAGDAAVFFDPDSPDEIASAIRSLLESPELRSDLARRGHLAVQKYSAEAAARDFADLYARVLQPKAASASGVTDGRASA